MADVIAELRALLESLGLPLQVTHANLRPENPLALSDKDGLSVAVQGVFAFRLDEVRIAVNALPAILDVAEASQRLTDALTACEPYFQTAAVLMQRMGPYTGPTFGAEHESLRAALARLEGRA